VRRLKKTPPDNECPRDTRSRGRYFTDGSNLYRFVEWLRPAGNAKLAAVEDCRTLGLLLVSGDYLTKARLRPVA
jgi:hypothetical protein